MSKRKRVVLSLKDKLNIVDSLTKGETGRKLANKYGVGTSTISDIKKNTNSILKYTCKLNSEEGSTEHRKVIKKTKNEHLEKTLYCWFLQNRSTGQPISGPLLCEKALQLNKKVGCDESFAASNGWLYRFKSRYGIRESEMKGEKMANDENAVKNEEHDAEEKLDMDKDAGPSHVEALQALELALKWFIKQPECDTIRLVQLKQIRDIAAMKRKSSLRQMKITKYFA